LCRSLRERLVEVPWEQVRAMGLLERRAGYYRAKITLTLAAHAGGWAPTSATPHNRQPPS